MNKWMSSHLDYFSDLLISPFFHASPWDMDSGKSKLSSDWHVSYHWTKSRSPEKRGSARPTVGPKELGLTGMVTWLLVPACFLSQHLSLLNSDITVSMTERSCKNQMKMHVKVPVHCKGAGTWGKLSSLLEPSYQLTFKSVLLSSQDFTAFRCRQMPCQEWVSLLPLFPPAALARPHILLRAWHLPISMGWVGAAESFWVPGQRCLAHTG